MLEIDRLRSKILQLENDKIYRVFSKKQLDFKNYPCEKASDRTVSDLTSLENCVQNIGGIAAKTASPTDIYVLDMKPNFKYDSEHIPKIYMKMFLSGTDQENVKIRNPLLDEELLYEYMIYLTKIKDIVRSNICPYFIRVLGGNLKVSLPELLNFITPNITDKPNSKEAQTRIARNILYLFSKQKGRPSISTPTLPNSNFESFKELITTSNYGYFMTEGTPNTNTLAETLEIYDNEVDNYENTGIGEDVIKNLENDIYIILFQLLMACKTMNMAKLAHNDLHAGNVLIESRKDKSCFLVNDGKYNKVYALNSDIRIHIFDFDRGFIEGKHPYQNKVLTPHIATYSQSNNLVYHRDFVKILSYFFVIGTPGNIQSTSLYKLTSLRKNIADILINDPTGQSETKMNDFFVSSGNFLQNPNGQGKNSNTDFKVFNRTFDEMLDITYSLIDDKNKENFNTVCDNIKDFDMYYIFPEIFDDEGMIKFDALNKIKSYIMKDECNIPYI
jgi:hypothetical protein